MMRFKAIVIVAIAALAAVAVAGWVRPAEGDGELDIEAIREKNPFYADLVDDSPEAQMRRMERRIEQLERCQRDPVMAQYGASVGC